MNAMTLATALLAFSVGCGARTGFEIAGSDGHGGADADSHDSGVADGGADGASGEDGMGNGTAYCAINVGPVSSCDAGAGAESVQLCSGVFSVCADEFPELGWGCCNPNPPGGRAECVYNGGCN
jgi:hypothetical protein